MHGDIAEIAVFEVSRSGQNVSHLVICILVDGLINTSSGVTIGFQGVTTHFIFDLNCHCLVASKTDYVVLN